MLKEVGASGQISLGKKYAGQLFEVQTAPDGTITLMPVKVVPAPSPHRKSLPATQQRRAPQTAGSPPSAWRAAMPRPHPARLKWKPPAPSGKKKTRKPLRP